MGCMVKQNRTDLKVPDGEDTLFGERRTDALVELIAKHRSVNEDLKPTK